MPLDFDLTGYMTGNFCSHSAATPRGCLTMDLIQKEQSLASREEKPGHGGFNKPGLTATLLPAFSVI